MEKVVVKIFPVCHIKLIFAHHNQVVQVDCRVIRNATNVPNTCFVWVILEDIDTVLVISLMADNVEQNITTLSHPVAYPMRDG